MSINLCIINSKYNQCDDEILSPTEKLTKILWIFYNKLDLLSFESL